MEKVILVNEDDVAIGTMDKLEVHRKGLLHRAFSVLLFNSNGELLIQKRAAYKYHSAGLWTNTCCSHPRPDEDITASVRRKLLQEMGIDVPTSFAYKFIYEANLENGLVEHELDHVFIGTFDGVPDINHEEVEDWRFISLQDLHKEIASGAHNFTPWFKLILEQSQFKSIAT